MRPLILLLAAALCGAAPAGGREFVELPPGRYTVALTGMTTAVCARAIAAEWSRLPELEEAAVDFAKEKATITVRLDRTLKVAVLRKSLRRAEKLANLGARYDIGDIAYRIGRTTGRLTAPAR